MSTKLITKETLKETVYKKKPAGKAVVYKNPIINGGDINSSNNEVLMSDTVQVKDEYYKSPYEAPCADGRAPIAERIEKKNFSLHIPSDLYDYVDKTRLDVTRRVLAQPEFYPLIYNQISNPGFSRTMTLQEIYPIGIKFDTNEGSDESVTLGDFKTGSTETITQIIKAAGYTWDLSFEMYNTLFQMQALNDAVARGYVAQLNHDHINPIVSGTYAGAKATAASTVGDTWMEKVYHTILNARRDLAERVDPVTDRQIAPTGLVLLCSLTDAEDIQWVINGQLNTPADSKNLSSIPGISAVIGYEGDTITVGDKEYDFPGIDSGTVYMIKPDERSFITAWKRQLTMLTQSQGNILKLERERRAWYYVNGIYNTYGITNRVQKITLPTIGG
jgi:hypothetical protein